MSKVLPTSPEVVYLSRDNIVHPGSAAQATAAEAAARLDLASRLTVASVSGGSIKR